MVHIPLVIARSLGTSCSTPTVLWMPPDPPPPSRCDSDAERHHWHRAESQPRPLLWIDDEIRPDDAVVRLLEMEGFRVDCAGSGATGLAMAQRTAYIGIILDLRLPDIPGLTVLAMLARQHIQAPVLVLTGYPDFALAVQAMRLGAWDCQSKTILLGDEWIDLVHALAEHGDSSQHEHMGPLSAHVALVRELLAFIEEIQQRGDLSQRAAEPAKGDLERLALRLVRTLADRRLNVFLFLVCAKGLKLTLTARANELPALFDQVSGMLKKAAVLDSLTPDWRVQATLARLAEAKAAVGGIREEEIARTLGVNRAHLGRLIREATGFTFKQWRWGFLLRPALVLLATSQEQVAQIAFSCGYGSPAQFDRDFRRMLHMSPKEYRQLIREISIGGTGA